MDRNKIDYTSHENKLHINKLENKIVTTQKRVVTSILLTITLSILSMFYIRYWIQQEKISHSMPIDYNFGIFFIVLIAMVIYFILRTIENIRVKKLNTQSLSKFLDSLKYEVSMPDGQVLYYDTIDENTLKGAYNILDAYSILLQDTTVKPNIDFKFKESLLPFPKVTIKQAGQTILNTKMTNEQKYDIERSLLFLNDYVPENEYEERYI